MMKLHKPPLSAGQGRVEICPMEHCRSWSLKTSVWSAVSPPKPARWTTNTRTTESCLSKGSGRGRFIFLTTGTGGQSRSACRPECVFNTDSRTREKPGRLGPQASDRKGERSGEIHFSYDRNGRPESVCLPSGVRVQYRFPNKGKTGSPGATGFKIQVMGPGEIGRGGGREKGE